MISLLIKYIIKYISEYLEVKFINDSNFINQLLIFKKTKMNINFYSKICG